MNLPWQILEFASVLRSIPSRMESRRVRSAIRRSQTNDCTLGFGGVLSGGGLIHGGAVKLLSLQKAFPCNEEEFHLLYLVSSAQPAFAEDLVRLCKKQGIRFVWNQNGVGYPAWAGQEAGRHNAPMRRLRKQADFVVYQSHFCQRSAERFLGSCQIPSRILLNPVDMTRFVPMKNPLPVKPLRLLAMGTQNYAERVLNTIDALAALRHGGVEATLTVAGRLLWKHAEEDVERHLRKSGMSEYFQRHPAFNQTEAVSLYQSHHILIHPKYMDPCPTVVAEALACGLPVVASDSGGLPEMTSSECARLITVPEDWAHMHTPTGEEMAEAVTALIPTLQTASIAARIRAESVFDSGAWIQSHRDIFLKVLNSSR